MELIVLNFSKEKELSLDTWRKLVLQRANYKCQTWFCSRTAIAHHKFPTILGGKNILSNGKALCRSHHGKAHQKIRKRYQKEYGGLIRNRHLVVCKETHEAISYLALKWNITITEVTRRLIAKFVEEYREEVE